MYACCEEGYDLSDEIAGLYYPTHEAFAPVRWLVEAGNRYVLYAVYDDVEETDVQADIVHDVKVIETFGGQYHIVHTIDPLTNLHTFLVYARCSDPVMMQRCDELAAAVYPAIPAS